MQDSIGNIYNSIYYHFIPTYSLISLHQPIVSLYSKEEILLEPKQLLFAHSFSLKLNPHVLQILDIGINNPSLLPLKIVVQLSTDFLHFGHFIECKRSIRQILVIIYPTKPNTG